MIDDDRPGQGPPLAAETGLPRITVAGAVLRLGDRYPVLGASLTVRAGEIVALVGAPGSGRTTLLHLVAGLHQPTFGIVEVCGRPAREYGAGEGTVAEGAPVPPVVLLDDPVAGRTPKDRRRLWRSLATARRLGAAVLVTLDPQDLYDAECDRVYLLAGGRTVAGGETVRMSNAMRAGLELDGTRRLAAVR